MDTSELELKDKCGEVTCFRVRRMIVCCKRVIVRIMVAAAVRDDMKLWGQNLHLRFPGAVVPLTSVEENGPGGRLRYLGAIEDDRITSTRLKFSRNFIEV